MKHIQSVQSDKPSSHLILPDVRLSVHWWIHKITLRKQSSVSPFQDFGGRLYCVPNVLIIKLKWEKHKQLLYDNEENKVIFKNIFRYKSNGRDDEERLGISYWHSQHFSHPSCSCSSNIWDSPRSQTTNIHQSFISPQGYNKDGEGRTGQAPREICS